MELLLNQRLHGKQDVAVNVVEEIQRRQEQERKSGIVLLSHRLAENITSP